MDIRSLSNKQLKKAKKQITRFNRKFFFWKRIDNPIQNGMYLDDIKAEIKRRKEERLKFRIFKMIKLTK